MYKNLKSSLFNLIPDGSSDVIYIGIAIFLAVAFFRKSAMQGLYAVLIVGAVVGLIDCVIVGNSFESCAKAFAHFAVIPAVFALFLKRTKI